MIVANLATYPPRREAVLGVVRTIAPQVDRLNVVLNQFDAPLPELASFENVEQIIPTSDTKDAGKFYPTTSDARYVLMIDDDIIYPANYVSKTLHALEDLGESGVLGGYHGSIYQKPKFSLTKRKLRKWFSYITRGNLADFRKVHVFRNELKAPVVVDQIATNAAIMRGQDMPPYSFMADSQKFVDVRLARWCFEKNITCICLPRDAGWLSDIRFDETIYEGFTQTNPPHVTREILSYAFKNPASGRPPSGAITSA